MPSLVTFWPVFPSVTTGTLDFGAGSSAARVSRSAEASAAPAPAAAAGDEGSAGAGPAAGDVEGEGAGDAAGPGSSVGAGAGLVEAGATTGSAVRGDSERMSGSPAGVIGGAELGGGPSGPTGAGRS